MAVIVIDWTQWSVNTGGCVLSMYIESLTQFQSQLLILSQVH